MAFAIGSGEWILANPKMFWRPNPPFVALKINFDNQSGTCETGTGMGNQPITTQLRNLVTTATTFRANYNFGANNGKIEAEIDDSRRLDITFTGTVETSVMGEPLKTRPPSAVSQALQRFKQNSDRFADTVLVTDGRSRQQYRENSEKFSQAILNDLKHKRISTDEAVREIEALRQSIAGLVVGGALLARMSEVAQAAATSGGHRWGGHGTMTVMEAFGNPSLADDAWVHFAPSHAAQSIRDAGITTTSHSSWTRWGEVKSFTYGKLVFQIGSMSHSAQSDLAVMAVAASGAPIREVKGLYGFKVEGEATVAVKTSVVESGYAKSLAEAQQVAGKTLVELEEAFASRRYAEVLRNRPGGAGKRMFERLSPAEQAQIRLDIVDSVNPNRTGPKPPATSRWAKIGRGLLVIAIAVSIYKVATAEDKLKQTAREAIGFAGGAAGGFVVATAASAYTPHLSPIIIGLGTFIGGLLGALGADFVFEWADTVGTGDLQEHF